MSSGCVYRYIYGVHVPVYICVCGQVESVPCHAWMVALHRLSDAECLLVPRTSHTKETTPHKSSGGGGVCVRAAAMLRECVQWLEVCVGESVCT